MTKETEIRIFVGPLTDEVQNVTWDHTFTIPPTIDIDGIFKEIKDLVARLAQRELRKKFDDFHQSLSSPPPSCPSPITIAAYVDTKCSRCGEMIEEGSEAIWAKDRGMFHTKCWEDEKTNPSQEETKPKSERVKGEEVIVYNETHCPACNKHLIPKDWAIWVRSSTNPDQRALYCLGCAEAL